MERVLITGGAGFIGSHLTGKLLEAGCYVVCVDNFVLGRRENVARYMENPYFELVEMDVSQADELDCLLKEKRIERIYHLAANSDIRKSAECPETDYINTFRTTYALLEGMRRNHIQKLFFSSTSAVYGEKMGICLTEGIGGLQPISYYGSAKLASEAFISSYAYMGEMQVLIFRFPNVIGPGLTHGVIFDFLRKLNKNSDELEILGDGTQCKPYLYVLDLVDAIVEFSRRQKKGVEIYNIGVEDAVTVKRIADLVCERLGCRNVVYKYTGGNAGWKGDVPAFRYDLGKIHAAGWTARHNSDEAVKLTLDCLDLQEILK